VALNQALKTHVDAVDEVASQMVQALRAGTRRRQLGWPEKLFAWLNGAFPALVDRGLRAALPVVRAHAGGQREALAAPRPSTAASEQAQLAAVLDGRERPPSPGPGATVKPRTATSLRIP
jgi:hypothetical protein